MIGKNSITPKLINLIAMDYDQFIDGGGWRVVNSMN